MTYPVTPNPNIKVDPTAKSDLQQQLLAEKAALQRMFSSLVPQIINLIVTGIVNNLGLPSQVSSTIVTDLNNFLAWLQNPGNINGLTSGQTLIQDFQSVVDHIVNFQGGSTTGNPVSAIVTALSNFFSSGGTFGTLLTNLFGSPSVGTTLHSTAIPDITRTMSSDIQAIIDNIHQAANGGSTTGNATTTVKTNLQTLFNNLFGTPTINTTLQTSAIPNITRTMSTDIQGVLDNIVNFLGTNTGTTNNTQTLAQQVMSNLQSNVVTTAQNVAQLQNQQSSAGNNGTVVNVNFASYANGAFPSDFTVTYSGSGTSTEVISGGEAAPNLVNDADRAWNVIWANNHFLSDYQAAYLTFDQGPYAAFGQTATTEIRLRENSAGTTYVWLLLQNSGAWVYDYSMGYCVSGTRTTWISPTAFSASSTIWFLAGTPGGLRQYQIKAGAQVIATYTESGTSSQVGVGSGYNNGGYFQQMRHSSGGAVTPGTLVGFGMADTSATTFGSYARIYRAATGTVASNIGDRTLPGSLFDNTQRCTSDITVDYTNGKFTVSKSGPYIFRFGCKFTAVATAQMIEPLCYVNGSIYERGDAMSWSTAAQIRYAATFVIYLNAGDYVQPGANFTATAPSYSGESTGTNTFMSLVAAGGIS